MTEYAKKECPVCKEMISEFPAAWQRHAKTHEAPAADVETREPPRDTAKPVKKFDPKREEDKILLEKALANQAEMLKAPNAFIGDLTADEHIQLRKIYAPETIGKNAKFCAYFGDKREEKLDVARGYAPVFNEHGEKVTNSGGDVLYTIPRVIRDARRRATEDESKARLRQVTERASKQNTAAGVVPQASADGLKEELLDVRREQGG